MSRSGPRDESADGRSARIRLVAPAAAQLVDVALFALGSSCFALAALAALGGLCFLVAALALMPAARLRVV